MSKRMCTLDVIRSGDIHTYAYAHVQAYGYAHVFELDVMQAEDIELDLVQQQQ